MYIEVLSQALELYIKLKTMESLIKVNKQILVQRNSFKFK